jgi:uncharacterized protein YhbP (UPF0306 family)
MGKVGERQLTVEERLEHIEVLLERLYIAFVGEDKPKGNIDEVAYRNAIRELSRGNKKTTRTVYAERFCNTGQ